MASLLTTRSILIVDDFQNMRSTLRKMLQSTGASDIDTVANGQEAVAQLARKPYDVVLCDYNLGEGKDGQQVLEEAKFRNLLRPSTVFVMITAENTLDMVMGAIEYKPDDYLTKPFNKDLLRSRLEKLIERKRALEPVEAAVARHDLGGAIARCDELIDSNPRSQGELLRLKLDLQIEAGDLDAAEATCEQALATREVVWARFGLGRVQFLRGQLETARDLFRAIVEKHPTYMEAYDWLARAEQALGESEAAQQTLSAAAELSPKVVQRQAALGELATRNRDHVSAERAYRRAVGYGRESVYRAPEHFTGLAKAQARNGSGLDAIKTLHKLRKEFADDPDTAVRAAVAEGEVNRTLGREAEARTALAEAVRLYESRGGSPTPEAQLEIAKAYLLTGDTEKGEVLMRDLVCNRHDDEAFLRRVEQAFVDAGAAEGGRRIVDEARREVANLNNEGVALARSGRLSEAIALFSEAVKRMPDNRTVNLNAAQVLLMRLQRGGGDPGDLERAGEYLERGRQEGSSTYRKVSELYRALQKR